MVVTLRDTLTATTAVNNNNSTNISTRRKCFYLSASTKNYKPRVELDDLVVGQELVDCVIVQELLDGKTGPKAYCDCGIGRCRDGVNWTIVNGMLRLDRKESVAKKRIKRLQTSDAFTAYVSRIRPNNDQFEIVTSRELIENYKERKFASAGALKPGQQVTGTVVRLEDYGVFVQLEVDGAPVNRPGLLHIQRVADLYGCYINKKEGLEEAGLERGARVKLQVLSNDKQRLFLDFTDDVKAEADAERDEENEPTAQSKGCSVQTVDDQSVVSEEVMSAWAEYNPGGEGAESLESENDVTTQELYYEDDDFDEDREIEDALGIGTY
jgi:predicted RNA-binding protein with RPS1 domain